MKTGIVFEIKNYQATIMKNNGEFITVTAKKGWQKGEVVTIKDKKINLKPLYAVAACFLLFISLSAYGVSRYYDETSIISVDVNPSIELKLNRYDKVIGINILNDDGQRIVDGIDIKNKNYDKAIELLLENESYNMYIKDNPNVVFTVSSQDLSKEEDLLNVIQSIADKIIYSKHNTANIEYYTVDNQIVEDAHHYGVTAGKYMTLLQLQEEIPEVDIQDYTHCSITEIKSTITQHHNSQNNTTETEHNNSENTSIEHNNDNSTNNQHNKEDSSQQHNSQKVIPKVETENHNSNNNSKQNHDSKKSH